MGENTLFATLPKGSISEIIMERITEAIINGDLKPGDKIPTELEFSSNLGVSRNAVREAIKVLVAFGVLEIRRSEGTFVVQDYNHKLLDPMIYGLILSEHSLDELLEVKIALYNSVLYVAMGKVTAEQVSELRRLGREFKESMNQSPVDKDSAYNAAKQFNQYLGQIAGNRMLVQLDSIMHEIATFTRYKAIEHSIERGCVNKLPDNYLEEVDLLESGDKSKIPAFMDKRLEMWKELVK